jgi:hypothetical protein
MKTITILLFGLLAAGCYVDNGAPRRHKPARTLRAVMPAKVAKTEPANSILVMDNAFSGGAVPLPKVTR